jgi:hypothetical protein
MSAGYRVNGTAQLLELFMDTFAKAIVQLLETFRNRRDGVVEAIEVIARAHCLA